MFPRINWRSGVAFLHDVVAAAAAWCLAYLFRLNFELEAPFATAMVSHLAWVVPLQAALFLWLGMYRGLWRYASLPDLRRILVAAGLGAMATAVVIVVFRIGAVPRSVIFLYPILLAVLMGGSRVAYRAWKEGHLRRLTASGARRVVILGADAAAANLLKSLGRSPEWHFVGLLDDDPRTRGREIQGVKVLGDLARLPEVVSEEHAELAVIAMPERSHAERRRAVDLCREANVPAMTVPSYEDLVAGKVTVSQLRRVELDDLLGRDPVQLDSEGLGGWLRGRTVLVTGAGGSIGAELCRQILRFEPAQLVAFDGSELALYQLEQGLGTERGGTRLAYLVGDVKSVQRLEETCRTWRPSVVFHAAAYKHVPLMEENPVEAVRNNAVATRIVAAAAGEAGAERFVLVSTDKAVSPATVMGASKALAEWAVEAAQNRWKGTRYASVRFGNVLGSSGSVVPIFRRQIAQGGPVTVTDPKMTRYFMTIPEAVQLIIRSGELSTGGEVFVLEMGDPVKIAELARNMIRIAGYEPDVDIAIETVGRRPGEKIHEDLFNPGERPQPTHAEKIVCAAKPALEAEWVESAFARIEELVYAGDAAALAGAVAELSAERALVISTGT